MRELGDLALLQKLRQGLSATNRAVRQGREAHASSHLLLRRLGKPFDRKCPVCLKVTKHQIRGGQVICLECF